MTDIRIPIFAASCLGVCCNLHSTCARYAAVNGAINAPRPMGTCSENKKERPGYIPLEVKS